MNNLSIPEIVNIVTPIAKEYGVDKVVLFGSRARGDNREDSDYDFLISKGKLRTFVECGGLLNELEERLNSNVDIVFDSCRNSNILDKATKEGKLVYERK